jgi:hypothetical protein
MYLEREETLFKTTLGGIMKGLERSSEQYTHDVKEVEPAKPVHADQYIEQPHHFYASSFCTWKTSPDIREVIKYMESEGNNYNLWYVPVDDNANYQIKYYAPQVQGAFLIGSFEPSKKSRK